MVEIFHRKFQCLHKGFAPTEPVDVVTRPEDVHIVDEASGQLKGTGDLETSSKYVFFGVAMSIFNPTQSIKQNMPAEKAAEIIVDRYLYGEALL